MELIEMWQKIAKSLLLNFDLIVKISLKIIVIRIVLYLKLKIGQNIKYRKFLPKQVVIKKKRIK